LRNLCAGAHLLIHEASGKGVGHSSAQQAGALAEELGVPELMLIHYPTYGENTDTLIREAESSYSGEVFLARDLMRFTL
jgi:ribonuclease BN (tRNA processing enzyme)